ncbi:copper resistance CopC/CopD family protein [Streptomyces poonensis]|uniref:Protein YobA n=1 Tax=Streptomyces poonensis TaxID=68255 RepID=A0A918PVQ1_9ACTN|nr:copper resistance protein CopC [Streptomyces poonensis]GGZ24613.1 transport integral membrane protein [Streptomyces poonensis]GLJ90004.1 transport integral membrane protein [Streptomyces poonensis]
MLLGAVLVLILLGAPGPASAHAALKHSDPRDGTVLKAAPRHVTLTFTESVSLLDDSLRVVDPGNRPVRTGQAGRADGRSDTVRATLPADLPKGTYTIAWRVVSADSHPIAGAVLFSVGEPSATVASPAAPTEDPATATLHHLARYVAYGGLTLLIGVSVFTAVTGGSTVPLRGLLPAGWWALTGATAALLLLRGPYERGTGPAGALDPSALADTVTSRPGVALLARLGLLAGLYFFVRRTTVVTRPAVVVGGVASSVGLALTWAAAEHASAGIQVPVAMTSSVLHLLAVAVWLGGLTALLTVLYRAPEELTVTGVARFSRLAFGAVTVLVVTGVYQSWRGLGSWDALTSTAYGRLLLAKLGAVLLLLVAAGLSRRWTARWLRAEEGADGRHRGGLRRSVLGEFTIAVAVLVVTTVLTGTLPGRAETESAAAAPASGAAVAGAPTASSSVVPFDVGTPDGRGKVQVGLTPGRVGTNSVQAVVFGPDGGISAVPEVRLTFTLRAQDVGPIDAGLENKGGYWGTEDLRLPLPGTWTMKITVRTTEVDQVTVEKDVRVG